MNFLEYKITCDFLYMGERTKAGIYKPCLRTIPYSQITGALRICLGLQEAKAVGYLVEDKRFNHSEILIYSPRERTTNISKVPIHVEYITNALGKVFIKENEDTQRLPKHFELTLGGLRSKGFGNCLLEKIGILNGNSVAPGMLKVRIPQKELQDFNIKRVDQPVYGYLFEPIQRTFAGNYILSLFEESKVIAPLFLIKQRV